MPALDVGNPGVSAVATFGSLLEKLLGQAAAAKSTTTIEPALNKSDFKDLSSLVLSTVAQVEAENGADPGDHSKGRQFAMIETAARDLFSKLIATTPIESPGFVKVWNLFDILSILSDEGQCDPALLFWLAEELLDSQTISGCRKIFDFLEARRERITANHFKQKQLIILRSCNELLRRLSRAEDTAFCGRVFIFMFQSFPLGDKSSVNLRGEYHVENVTTYENVPSDGDSKMDVDSAADTPKDSTGPRGTPKEAKKADKPLEPDALYPLFWSLQESFSQPKRLFELPHFTAFKENLGATMKVFQTIHNDQGARKSAEDTRRSLKRKREDGEEGDASDAFNPKYLTSRDLFELEISDLSFRRHVLVQALITMDFLLSLSAQARDKLSKTASINKSVMYMDQILSEDDTKWANDMKKTIADYLRQGSDGPYFYRMVETVLARDKNWVRWKIEGCMSIIRDPISPASFVESRGTAQRTATNKRLRPTPLGAVSVEFLRSENGDAAMERLKAKERYELPQLDSFKRKIADDDFEIEMPTNDQTKAAAVASKASKSWRALRIAARTKLAAFDKIDDPKKIDVIFEELTEADDGEDTSEPTASDNDMPPNREPIVISGPAGASRTALITKLMEEHKGVFATVVRHAVREPEEGEVNGKTFHFAKALEFNQLRDGDRLIEYGTREGVDYGTSSKVIDAVVETGKVPIIDLDLEAAKFAKDMDFQARFILIKHADFSDTDVAEVFSSSVLNDDIEQAAKALGRIIYESGELQNGDGEMKDADSQENDEDEEPMEDVIHVAG
ncbi:hypothetical protein G7046_g4828 [Stylonectria norvegica]|nr:hypothetical protein G7046_g4828 [Stylonectria norvegica]